MITQIEIKESNENQKDLLLVQFGFEPSEGNNFVERFFVCSNNYVV